MGGLTPAHEFTAQRFRQCSDAGVQMFRLAVEKGCSAAFDIAADAQIETVRECVAYTQGALFEFWRHMIGGMPDLAGGVAGPAWVDPKTDQRVYPGDPRLHETQVWYARVVAAHASNDPNLVMDLWMTVPEGKEITYMAVLLHFAALQATKGGHRKVCKNGWE